MIYKLEDINLETKAQILRDYYNEVEINDIAVKYKLAKNTLLSLLASERIYYKKEDAPSFNISGDKVLIISDTHIGSKYENLKYIDIAYNKGIKKGVCACLHLGDILQGEYNRSNKNISYQLEVLSNVYPFIDEFKTYLLLGNHDYNVFENSIEAKRYLLSLEKFIVLGYKKAYFDWNNYLFSMDHKVKYVQDEMLHEDCALSFIGHGHEPKIKSETKIKVPTLSDDIINQTSIAVPGFMIANLYDDYLDVDIYALNNYNSIRKKHFYEKDIMSIYKVRR